MTKKTKAFIVVHAVLTLVLAGLHLFSSQTASSENARLSIQLTLAKAINARNVQIIEFLEEQFEGCTRLCDRPPGK